MEADSSDLEIIARVLAGDTDDFESLVQRYQDYLFAVISKYVPYDEVDEVAQESFIQAYQNLAVLRDGASFKSWLTTIAVRRSYDFWRRRRRARETPESALSGGEERRRRSEIEDGSLEAHEANAESYASIHAQLLERSLSELSPGDRLVITLLYFEDKPVREVSKLLGISYANVKVRAFRARLKLKKSLKELGVEL